MSSEYVPTPGSESPTTPMAPRRGYVATATATRAEPRAPEPRRGPRRARLALRRLDPWSVLKTTFVYSLALLVILVVAVAVLYLVLDTMGVFDSLDATIRDLTSSSTSAGITGLFAFRRIIGWTAFLGAINVVIVTALATLGAFLYNLCADIAGGVEVTLSERD